MKKSTKILIIGIIIPIVALLVITGWTAIWSGLRTIVPKIFPNLYVVGFDIYILVIAYLFGRAKGK